MAICHWQREQTDGFSLLFQSTTGQKAIEISHGIESHGPTIEGSYLVPWPTRTTETTRATVDGFQFYSAHFVTPLGVRSSNWGLDHLQFGE
jgi:hypothetical protein